MSRWNATPHGDSDVTISINYPFRIWPSPWVAAHTVGWWIHFDWLRFSFLVRSGWRRRISLVRTWCSHRTRNPAATIRRDAKWRRTSPAGKKMGTANKHIIRKNERKRIMLPLFSLFHWCLAYFSVHWTIASPDFVRRETILMWFDHKFVFTWQKKRDGSHNRVFPSTWEWEKCYWQCDSLAQGLSDKM